MEQKPTEASPLVAEGDVKPARRCLEEYRGGVFETAFIIAYFVASQTGIILCNKLIAYEIPALPMTIMCIQMAFCAIVFCCPPILFWHNFGRPGEACRWAMILPLLYVGQMSSSQLSMGNTSLAAQSVFRSITPLMSLAIEAVSGERVVVTWMTVISLLSTFGVGALYFVADNGHSTTGWGVFWNLLQDVIVVAARIFERRFLVYEGFTLTISSALLLNSAIGAPIQAGIAVAAKEPWRYAEFEKVQARGWALLMLSCVFAVGISFSALLLTKKVTATTKIVVTNSSKSVTIIFGMAVLRESHSPVVVVAAFLNLLSSAWYGYAQQRIKEGMVWRPGAATSEGAERGCFAFCDREIPFDCLEHKGGAPSDA